MISDALVQRLHQMTERHEELGQLLGTPEILNDLSHFKRLSQEFSRLTDVVGDFHSYQTTLQQWTEAKELFQSTSDSELKQMARDEILVLAQRIEDLKVALYVHLIPKDSSDDSDIFLEIRAGAGGDEAGIFAGDLFRMYSRYIDQLGWSLELLSESQAEHGGFKEVVARVSGHGAYGRFKFESGVHRVQRVPQTEAQGRVHTSTCTVAILPEVDEVHSVDINPADLKVDTYRASGAGGQHVNKTDSAIRITHLPSGLVVECQDERSQHKNRSRAMSLLKARLLEQQRSAQRQQQEQTRRLQVGSGDRSERIRTYNFPQNRLTEHRINLTLYQLDSIIDGHLEVVIEPLLREHQTELLQDLER